VGLWWRGGPGGRSMRVDMAAYVEGRAAAASIACRRLIASSTPLAALQHAQEASPAFALVVQNKPSALSLSHIPSPTISAAILQNALEDISDDHLDLQ
jgi:hypothetical protein